MWLQLALASPPPLIPYFRRLLLLLLCHLSVSANLALIISWHILCSVKNVSCHPVRKLFLELVFYLLSINKGGPALSCRQVIRAVGCCGGEECGPEPHDTPRGPRVHLSHLRLLGGKRQAGPF